MGIRGDVGDNRLETGVVASAPQSRVNNRPFHQAVESADEESAPSLWITSASFTGRGTFRNRSESEPQETPARY